LTTLEAAATATTAAPPGDTAATLADLVARLAATDDAAVRRRMLGEAVRSYVPRALAERLKEEADRARYQDMPCALRWCADIVLLGHSVGEPTVVALGRMVEALLRYDQGRYHDSLALFDEASALFRARGDEVGWARVQIGRIGPCRALARFDEALERAQEARVILARAGEHPRVANIDTNLAMLLEHMNRLPDALTYSERALTYYRNAGLGYNAMDILANHALLLWRLGRVREALATHREARAGYARLGAATEAAREDANIGSVYLVLGQYAEAVSVLTHARRDLLAAQAPYSAALAGLRLAEAFIHLGRFQEAIDSATRARDEFGRCDATVGQLQSLVWRSLAQTSLRQYDAALDTLESATDLLNAHDGLLAQQVALDVSRAQLLLESNRVDEARALLAMAIPTLHEAGLTVDAAAAHVLWGRVLVRQGCMDEAATAASMALSLAEREGLAWLAVRALHLRGQVALYQGEQGVAWESFVAAVHHLDQVQRRVSWDDHATYADTVAAVYTDTIALAVQRDRPAVALRYVERARARALSDHVRGRIDVRPRARDARSRALVDELGALRERYAWMGATRPDQSMDHAVPAAVRWATEAAASLETREEAVRIEHRMAAIWRELQAGNPAYRGEAAALDVIAAEDDVGDDVAAQRWMSHVQDALGQGDDVALLEYAAQGDDLLLFVLRSGTVRVVRLDKASAAVRRFVPLLRLNVESSAATAASSSGVPRALGANARGVLRRLHDVLLAPAAPLLDGATRLVVVPHGPAHHVPFHALHDGRGYLVERCEVSYTPSASLLEHVAARHRLLRNTHAAHERGALALSCSLGGALPHAGVEGAAVVAALGGRLLYEQDATVANLRAHAGDYTVLHLATHACFRPDEPLFSSLQLHDGRLSTMDVFDLELRCSLATLSACETALGTAGAGDELMGLSRAFLYAGAPSLLLSLWKVEDRSTAALMEVFYRSLGAGASKAAALRQAQLALLRHDVETERDYSAPYFWAPFELIGHAGPL